jgi:hypothetical protein
VRRFLAPRWLATHLLLVLCCAVMVRLGIWQWHVGGIRHGDLRNYAYALQWWAFCGFAVFFWVRLMRDARRSPQVTPPAAQDPPSRPQYRRYAMPQSRDIQAGDGELSEYNAYLRSLDER